MHASADTRISLVRALAKQWGGENERAGMDALLIAIVAIAPDALERAHARQTLDRLGLCQVR